jgi:hypothetical protein
MDQTVRDVLSLQDVQLANAMTNLKNNPSQLIQFIQQQKSSLYNTVTKEHSDNFQKVYNDLERAGDTVKITQGCDKAFSTCISFSNAANYRGFPHIPGLDYLASGKQ